MKGIGYLQTFIIFGSASLLLILITQFVIPFLTVYTGIEPIIFWLLYSGFGVFLPLIILAILMLKREGLQINLTTLRERLRFKKVTKKDWLWSISGIIIIGFLSFSILQAQEIIFGTMETQPPFMSFEPLTSGRYWILALWFPSWILNIMGEEIIWRGVMLPRQEIVFGKRAWLVNSIGWSLFHVSFGFHLFLTMLPILFVQPYIAQRTQNTWTNVIIHAVINGPSFVLIAFGVL